MDKRAILKLQNLKLAKNSMKSVGPDSLPPNEVPGGLTLLYEAPLLHGL